MIQIGAVEYECECESTTLADVPVDDLEQSLLLLIDVQEMDMMSARHLHHLVAHGRARVVIAQPVRDAATDRTLEIVGEAEATRHSAPLTGREREVAGLAAWGLTNRQIAARLGTSARTVGNQLQRVYDKLGIHSRSLLQDHFDPEGTEGVAE